MRIHGDAGITINPNGLSCVYETNSGGRLILRHDGWGTATLQAVRPIARREIPAFAGMTNEGVERVAKSWEIPACAGMTWEIPACAGMTESLICCGPGAIHAAKVNGNEQQAPSMPQK